MNATVTCEKCGKPLGMFDGNICNECENRAVLDKISAEINDAAVKTLNNDRRDGLYIARDIVDRYR